MNTEKLANTLRRKPPQPLEGSRLLSSDSTAELQSDSPPGVRTAEFEDENGLPRRRLGEGGRTRTTEHNS